LPLKEALIAATIKVTCARVQFFEPPAAGEHHKRKQGTPAMDLIVLGIGILFFVLSLAYVKACNRI